jgi:hypothetical protein
MDAYFHVLARTPQASSPFQPVHIKSAEAYVITAHFCAQQAHQLLLRFVHHQLMQDEGKAAADARTNTVSLDFLPLAPSFDVSHLSCAAGQPLSCRT